MFTRVYGIWDHERDSEDEDYPDDGAEDEDDVESLTDAVQKKRHDFLQIFTSKELNEIESIVHFLEETVGWAMHSNWQECIQHDPGGPSN